MENAGLELDDEGSVFADSTSMRAGFNPLFEKPDKTITPYVIMCATMWHENEREMEQILFSVLRYVPKTTAMKHKITAFHFVIYIF